MQNFFFMAAIVKLMSNYVANYAASAANGNRALRKRNSESAFKFTNKSHYNLKYSIIS